MDSMKWRKSTRSGANGGTCVEVARTGSRKIAARDSKNPKGPQLRFAEDDWRAFLSRVKRGGFDL
jgi:hypothetical protein